MRLCYVVLCALLYVLVIASLRGNAASNLLSQQFSLKYIKRRIGRFFIHVQKPIFYAILPSMGAPDILSISKKFFLYIIWSYCSVCEVACIFNILHRKQTNCAFIFNLPPPKVFCSTLAHCNSNADSNFYVVQLQQVLE